MQLVTGIAMIVIILQTFSAKPMWDAKWGIAPGAKDGQEERTVLWGIRSVARLPPAPAPLLSSFSFFLIFFQRHEI